jgi:hypothetical protein
MLPFEADPMAAAYAQQQLDPQGFFGNLLGQVGRPLGSAVGGMLGNRNLGGTIGGIAGQLGRMLPFEADPMAAAYAQQQLAPQTIFGDLFKNKLPIISPFFPRPPIGSGGIGTGIPNLRNLLPFEADPMAAAYAQQQLDPQGFFGNLLGQVGRPLGSAVGGMLGNRNLGGTIGGIAGQLGRLLPFDADPMAEALAQQQLAAQQQQLEAQGFFGNLLGQVGRPLGSAVGGMLGNRNLGGQIGGIAGQLGRLLPFEADPMAAAYYQQQLDPQGFFGNLLGQVGRPLGSAVGGMLGNRNLGGQIGGFAGQLGRLLPFEAGPDYSAYGYPYYGQQPVM